MGQPRAKTGAKLRPNRANIGQQQQQQPPQPRAKTGANLRPNTTTTTARAAGSAFAGARLSGVSLINPGAGPGPQPVALPEAFGGNRRLYTAAAPAADHRRPPPVNSAPRLSL